MLPEKTTVNHSRVMIVDDDEDDIYLMKRALSRLQESARVNLDLTFVYSGSEALGEIDRRLVDNSLPSKIFLDLNMPGINGLDVLSHCMAQNILDEVEVVVITTASDPDTHNLALANGARTVCVKPNSLKEMSDLISSLLAAE
ncbi:response regulator [Breoghania sp.]|uniref:response regulator n=1 Tax=Breoghania sp. TaxID=2065378 RepID=UPI002AA75B30|nr:response regulator [Breoghania sp.]